MKIGSPTISLAPRHGSGQDLLYRRKPDWSCRSRMGWSGNMSMKHRGSLQRHCPLVCPCPTTAGERDEAWTELGAVARKYLDLWASEGIARPDYHVVVAARVRRDVEWLVRRCQQFQDYLDAERA